MDQKTDKVEQVFVDVKLENKVLRAIIFTEADNKTIGEEMNKNISYIVNMGISKEYFQSEFKQWLFQLIIDKFIKYAEVTPKITILEFIEKKYLRPEDKERKKILLDKICEHSFNLKTFKHIIDDLRNKHYYRILLDLNLKLNDNLQDHHNNQKSEAVEIARDIDEINKRILMSSDRFRIIEEDIFQNVEKDILLLDDKRKNPEKYRGITSGYTKIDELTGGWGNGELITILGRPGVGKSILALNFGFNAYMMKYNVFYVTIEMALQQQKRRFHSLLTKINYTQLKRAELLNDETFEHFSKILKEEKEKHKNYFWLIDAPANCDVTFIESRVISFENVTGQKIDLIIIDPIYLMKPSEKSDDPVGTTSWDLKLLARKLNLPIINCSQFNRAAKLRHDKGKASDTSDAAFSDKLGNNSDTMIGLLGDKNDPMAQMQFPKTRDAEAIKSLVFKKDFHIMRYSYAEGTADKTEIVEENLKGDKNGSQNG
jgi:replicative DNA helicase